ncbi:MAG TPA: protein kinase [Polyangiaceae bacterium]|nr:protein kinase [Polyangiaceae bacterium]
MVGAAYEPTQTLPFGIGALIAGRYEVRGLLGEGGMGAVVRAYDRELDDEIALKVLHADVAKDAAALTRFRREVKLARRVTHRNVARTFDLGLEGTTRFLTMELISGESVARRAAQQRLPLPEVLRIAAEIARGLSAAHVVGVVHRDLKPDNVMLSHDRVVITDFGIARVADGVADVMRTGMIVGTPAYMAPEQIENLAVDGRTDVYAFGTMMYELLAGKLPFTGDSALAIAARRLTSEPPDLRGLAPSVPESVVKLVDDMLTRRREDRPDAPTVLERIEALRGNAVRAAGASPTVPTLSTDVLANLGRPRTIGVRPLAVDPASADLGRVLDAALVGALTEARVGKVLASPQGATDLIVSGSIHASRSRVRVRLGVEETHGTSAPWAGHVDGDLSDSLELEDRVVEAVADAVRSRATGASGPADKELREGWEKARDLFQRFGLPDVRKAIAILEELEARRPGDPHVRILLARSLGRTWGQIGGTDMGMLARIEELAMRVLEADPAIADAHHVIGFVRSQAGELVAAVRAEQECLRLAPLHAEAHQFLGSLLCDSLHIDEGVRRLELAARLEPRDGVTTVRRLTVLALLGEEKRARELLAEADAASGPLSTVVFKQFAGFWWNDKAMAAEVADLIEKAAAGASWARSIGILRAFARGEYEPTAVEEFAQLTSPRVGQRHRCLMHEKAAEYFALWDEREAALAHVEAAARLPFTDLLWMDRCPTLGSVRGDPRFAEARAVVAARVVDLWGTVA